MTADEACDRALKREALYAALKNLGIPEEDRSKWAVAHVTGKPMLAEGWTPEQIRELFDLTGLPVAAVFVVPCEVSDEVRSVDNGVLTCSATINGEPVKFTFNT